MIPWRRRGQRGQMLVIFAGSMIAFMMLSAMVVDVGWYWSSGLKMQRAVDAAALAGAVYLPDNFNGTAPNAQTAAAAAAKRNGYDSTNSTLTSVVDANNPRQLDVTLSANVGTLFLRAVGMSSLYASRSSKAEFVLPVPMGSPLSYYGVGTFVGLTPAPYTLAAAPTVSGVGAWTNPDNAFLGSNVFSTEATANDAQIWKTFVFAPASVGATIDGFTVGLELKDDTTGCSVKTEVSWDKGVTWGNLPKTAAITTNTDNVFYTLGSTTDDSVWGSNHPTWLPGDFTTADNFQVRLTYLKPAACTGTVSLDQITATVYSHTNSAVETIQAVANPIGASTPPASQGFWGAAITKGGDRQNGDQFDPANDGKKGTSNPDYTGLGVDYNVVITGSAGQVQIFDPTFCETGTNSSGSGHYGAGDHWISGSPNGVTTVYTLYDQNGTPYDIGDDIQMATSGNLFANEIQSDKSGDMGSPTNVATDCSQISNPATGGYWHNKWWQLATGLPAGTYRLNVSTDTGNVSTSAENGWSLLASSTGGTARVYGQGTMVAYTNLIAGTSRFYLAQIDKVHAGKTLEIHVFDPDSMTGTMRILSPDGNAQNYVNFNWSADNGQGGTDASSIAITPGGFNDVLVTITIPLPTTYGSGGLWGSGWWQIEYNVGAGNDTTTWAVDIRGNPVHLLVP